MSSCLDVLKPWYALAARIMLSMLLTTVSAAKADELTHSADAAQHVDQAKILSALERSGENRAQIEMALRDCDEAHRTAVRFLIAYMPERDLQELEAAYILKNVEYAYRARAATPWGKQIPESLFLNDVLPYASVNERRDDWRQQFFDKFLPLVADCATPSEAAQRLNRDMYSVLDVKYHASKRPKPDQSPFESIEAKFASCTGLSILLIDACRSVCVPARFAGTPRWAQKRGNHSWVEVWDGQWHFTGACEYNAGGLNQSWFQRDASHALRDDRYRAIYASSWMTTGTTFPLIWNRNIDYVGAVNVTDRYAAKQSVKSVTPEQLLLEIDVRAHPGGPRIACNVVILDDDRELKKGESKGPDDDSNHHLEFILNRDTDYDVHFVSDGGPVRTKPVRTGTKERQRLNLFLDTESSTTNGQAAPDTLQQLAKLSNEAAEGRDILKETEIGRQPLGKQDALQAAELIWKDHACRIREARAAEMKDREIKLGDKSMKFDFTTYGDKPAGGRSLFISLHGGGRAPARVNDGQWENQKRLYKPQEGVYVAPRAPTNTWNLWHEPHIDPLFDRLIENLVVFEGVNPNRVYVMGYSAGGDGVYQLAPRMADRWAAAAMMAGHPNDASPLGLYNIGFALHMGASDGAYNRNEVARQWKERLSELQRADSDGYRHQAIIHDGKGHWMDRQDAVAVPWMAEFTRNPFPRRIIWKQDDVTHSRFYWLSVDSENERSGSLIRASRVDQTIHIESEDVDAVSILLNDEMLDLDRPVTILFNGEKKFEGKVERTALNLALSFSERADPSTVFSARVRVRKPE